MSKLVFITGGSSGIGKATVEKFAYEGFDVCFSYFSNKIGSEDIGKKYKNVQSFQLDMSLQIDVEKVFSKIFEFYGKYPDILVNNAGIVSRNKFPDISGDDFENILKVNTVGPYRVTREFFIRSNGNLDNKSVIFVGSMRGWSETATTIDYSASKSAIHNMVSSLAKVMTPCRVNGIAPGFTKTPMHKGNYERLEVEAQKSVLKRYSESSEMAELIFFLSSDSAKSITGQVIKADNGRGLMI